MNSEIHKDAITRRLAEESKLARESVQNAGDTADIIYAGYQASKLDMARHLIEDVIFIEGDDVA